MEGNNRGLRIIFALLLPFSALFYAIKNYRNSDSKWFFVFGLSFLGFTINMEGDIERYRDTFYELKNVTWSKLFEDIFSLKIGDFYVSLVAKFFGTLFELHNIYIAFLISVFAFFYFSVIKIFIDFLPKKLDFFLLKLFFGFILFISLRNFISVRFTTATLVLIYGLLNFMITDKKKYLLFVFLTPIIHLSFIISLPFVAFYIFFKNKYKIALILMITCYFLGQSNAVNFLNKTSENNSENAISEKIKTYASEQGLETLNERYSSTQANIKLQLLNNLKKASDLFIAIGIILIFYYRKEILKDDFVIQLYTLILILWSVSNLMLEVSNGDRFKILYLFLGLSLFLVLEIKKYLNNNLTIYLKFGILIVIFYGISASVASNVLFKPNYFISNYFVEIFVFQN